MNKFTPNKIRSAFTLIEVLIVVSIIGLLVTITTPLIGHVFKSQGKARAKADMAVIATATEEFASAYGTYPRFSASNSEIDAGIGLLNCLIGKTYYIVEQGEIRLTSHDSGSTKAFVDISKLKIAKAEDLDDSEVNPEDKDILFCDPWRQPYVYVFDTSDVVGSRGVWKRRGFILLSKGPDTLAIDVDDFYVTGLMPKEEVYRDPPENIDNIVNGVDL